MCKALGSSLQLKIIPVAGEKETPPDCRNTESWVACAAGVSTWQYAVRRQLRNYPASRPLFSVGSMAAAAFPPLRTAGLVIFCGQVQYKGSSRGDHPNYIKHKAKESSTGTAFNLFFFKYFFKVMVSCKTVRTRCVAEHILIPWVLGAPSPVSAVQGVRCARKPVFHIRGLFFRMSMKAKG